MTPARCVSMVTVPYSRWTYNQATIYEARPRRDGAVTWRAVARIGARHRSPAVAERKAREYAATAGVPFLSGVRHGVRV